MEVRTEGMERAKGLEPSSSAWKAEVLPLNYTRKACPLVASGSCTRRSTRRARWLMRAGLCPIEGEVRMVGEAGFEPAKA